MNIRRVLHLLRTRWYLAVAVLLVLAGAFVAAFATFPAQYQSRAILVVTTPDNGGRISADPRTGNDITNPLFNFQGGQNVAAAILIASAGSPVAQAQIGTATKGSTYTVSDGSTNPEVPSSGPFIYVDATGPSEQTALDTSQAVVQFIRADLLNRQVALRAPQVTFLSVVDVVDPTPPVEQQGNRYLAGVVAALVCLVLSVVLVDLLDRRATRRRRAATSPSSPARPSPTPRTPPGGLDAQTETMGPPRFEGTTPSDRAASRVGRR
ncbi:hypothetical protein [Actinomycetospora chiangmaiensis]|uniref:hypothetical protein n=1 Tax=Actinomycetospora chiangmaiensis TaxID=402650 RepID=UPI0003625586|nr:hypothetical protein [Actinomycetospora chiangmaiensis]